MPPPTADGADLHAHRFEMIRTEERWEIGLGEPRLVELRSERGGSLLERTAAGLFITTSSGESVPKTSDYGGVSERLLARVFDLLPGPDRWQLRRVRCQRTITLEEETAQREEHYVSLRSDRGLGLVLPFDDSIVSHVEQNLDRILSHVDASEEIDESLPLLWKEGTGSILLHEAAGHPAEVGAAPLRWPEWLRVIDDPSFAGLGSMKVDDTGLEVDSADLTAGERPRAFRREGYRDVPLRRMSSLRVLFDGDRVEPPADHIEVRHLAGGEWDPATDRIRIRIAVATQVRGRRRRPLRPFTWSARRADVPTSLLGALGTEERYPGVLCRDEGQRVPVGSSSPDLLTRPIDE